MSLVARIFSGMGALIVLMIIVGGFATYQTNGLANTFVEYRQTARTSLLANEVAQTLAEMRLASLNFRQSEDDGYLEQLSQRTAKVSDLAPQLINALDGYDERASLRPLTGLITDYEASTDRLAQLKRRRAELSQQTADLGRKARQQMSDVMQSAIRENDAQTSSAAGFVTSNLLLGRLYLERFLVTGSQAAFNRSITELATAQSGLDDLLADSRNSGRQTLLQTTKNDLDLFKTAAENLRESTISRDELYARLDEIGPEILAMMKGAVDAVVERQNTLGPRGAQKAQNSILVVSGLVCFGAIAGLVLAFLIGRNISRRLSKVTEDMTELANGNLDITIERDAGTHEIGKMTNAMAVFVENARHARDLDAEIREKERKEQERVEEERVRALELAEEKLREEKERSEERARMSTIEDFQSDMERVLSEAAKGNFSLRLSAKDNSNPALANLAQTLNELLQATEKSLSELVSSIGELAKGNLGVRIEGERQGVFQVMKDDFNSALITLSNTMAAILQSGNSVSETSSDLKRSSGEMALRAESNAATAEETSAAVEQITASIRQVVENAKAADQATQRVRESADKTRTVSTKTEASINEMTEASAQINRVVKVIEDIAFQINLLALNAGVEAARAGEAGLGFSVVASEVRALALRSQEAVQEITEVIQQSNRSVESGVEQVALSREALEGIIKEVEIASGQISEIASAVEEQAKGIEEINGAIRTIDVNAQKNAATIEEMTASSISLSEEADQLSTALHQFKGVQTKSDPRPLQNTPVTTFKHSEPVRPQPSKVASMAGNGNKAYAEDDGWDEF